MKRFNSIGLTLVFVALIDAAFCQTVAWQRQPCWDAVEMLGNHLLKVEQSGKWGLVNFDGDVVLPLNYAGLTDIREDRFLVMGENGRLLSLGDSMGNVIRIEGEWFVDEAWPYFSHGLLAVRNPQNLWGYMDKTGKVVIKARHKNAFPFFFGLASVCVKDKWHLINTKGEVLSVSDGTFRQKNFRFVSSFTKNDKGCPLAMVFISDKIYLVDEHGNVTNDIIPVEGATFSGLESGKRFECVEGNSFMEIELNDVVEITSIKKGKMKFEFLSDFMQVGSFPKVRGIDVESNGTIKVGKLVIRPQFQEAIALNSDRLLVKKNGKWGLLKFDLNEPSVGISFKESPSIELCHNRPMLCQIVGKKEKVRAYTLDDVGNIAFLEINPESGDFFVRNGRKCNSKDVAFIVGLETDGVLLEPQTFTRKVSDVDGFKVTGPASVIVSKSGKGSFEITVWNHTEQDAAPFDVGVENGEVMHFDGLPAKQSVSVPVKMFANIPALEDYVVKTLKVNISEAGMPERTYKVTTKFVKPSKKG